VEVEVAEVLRLVQQVMLAAMESSTFIIKEKQ